MEKAKNIIYKLILILICILGIYIRTKYYIASDVFEDDECRLAFSMMNKPWWLMLFPTGPWSSTPIFMLISKFIAEISDYSEKALKFIPYLSSVLSIFAFYKLSCKYFKKKIFILTVLYLFVINSAVLYFTAIFKTYSLDVLVGILCLYYLPELDLTKYNYKKLIIIGICLSIIPFLSLTSVFFIAAFFCINLFSNIKNKNYIKKVIITGIPFLFFMGIYYIIYLIPAKNMMLNAYQHFYNLYYAKSFYLMCVYNIDFCFHPAKYTLFNIILICLGIILTVIFKKFRNKFDTYLLLTLCFTILAAVLHIYPIINRSGLFLVPIILLLFIKPLDCLDFKKIYYYIVLLLTVICIFVYFIPIYIDILVHVNNSYFDFSPKVLIQDIYEKYDKKNDIVIPNEASLSSFLFYREKFKMYDLSYTTHIYDGRDYKIIVNEFLNNLPKNKNYWFYMVKEYKLAPETAYILQWLQDKKVEYKKQDKKSYIIYLKN